MRRVLLSLCLVAISAATFAQSPEPLFVERVSTTAVSGDQTLLPRAVVERSIVGMRIDWLLDRPEGVTARVWLNVADQAWIARLERVDRDAAGFRSWVGAIEDIPHSHVVFTERDGVVSGLIDAVGTTYQVRTSGQNTYLLERVDTAALGDELEPLASDTAIDHSSLTPNDPRTAGDDSSTIDVLMLYTPSARQDRGGTAQIQALVAQIMSDTNTAFARSGIAARVRLAGVGEFAAMEAADMYTDLVSLSSSPTARAWRDIARADLVQLLVSSPDQAACGFGYQLSSLSTTNFDAYSVADIACAAQHTPTHEMGHNMGAHHAPDDGAFGALFPYSYGYKDPSRGFRTVMAYGCGVVACARVLNFSNPAIPHNGAVTGTSAQNNARTVNEALFTVASFSQARLIASEAPSAPTNLRSHVIGQVVHLAWDAVRGASSYWLQVGNTAEAPDVFDASVGDLTAVSGVVNPGTYHWRVFASNAAENSPASPASQFVVAGCTLPGPPGGFAFTVQAGVVTLTWSAPTTGTPPTAYIVEAGTAAGLADLFSGATTSDVSAVVQAPPGAYYARVRAANVCGTGPASTEQLIVVR